MRRRLSLYYHHRNINRWIACHTAKSAPLTRIGLNIAIGLLANAADSQEMWDLEVILGLRVAVYGCRPKSVAAGLGCGLG